MIQHNARLTRSPRHVSPTEAELQDLHLPVPQARFDRAMGLAARDMGGTYDPATGRIQLPQDLVLQGDRTFPKHLHVLYRKFPCAFLLPSSQIDDPSAGQPCVSFDVIPEVPGDPRRSRVHQSFAGSAESSKTLFGKFLGWLKIVSKALSRYRRLVEQGRAAPFARTITATLSQAQAKRVSSAWLLKRLQNENSRRYNRGDAALP